MTIQPCLGFFAAGWKSWTACRAELRMQPQVGWPSIVAGLLPHRLATVLRVKRTKNTYHNTATHTFAE